MTTRRRNFISLAVLAATLGLAVPLAGVSTAAEAAPTCSSAGTSGVYASASCSGYGHARVVVECKAIWPFTAWTDFGSWVRVGGAASIASAHVHCAAPVSVRVQYR
jgi:hypothetical protein